METSFSIYIKLGKGFLRGIPVKNLHCAWPKKRKQTCSRIGIRLSAFGAINQKMNFKLFQDVEKMLLLFQSGAVQF